MAADEALFNAAANLPYAATLRLYSWSPPTLSLGRRQKLAEVNMEKCRAMGIDVVKRIGGGAAVYHGDELTYCFVSRNDLLPMPTGEQWHAALSLFLRNLGLTPDAIKVCGTSPNLDAKKAIPSVAEAPNIIPSLARRGYRGGSSTPPTPSLEKGRDSHSQDCPTFGIQSVSRHNGNACFACAAVDEPTIGGKKFVGSARRKSKAVFLQHGSILLSPQPAFLRDLLPGAEPDASLGLKTPLPSLTRDAVHTALIAAIEKTFSLRFPSPGQVQF